MAASEKNTKAIERALTLRNVPWCEAYELMISGMAYTSWDSPELEMGRLGAMRLLKRYNQTDPFEEGVDRADVYRVRAEILESLLGDIRDTPTIETPFTVLYGCNTSIGSNFFGNTGLAIDDSAFVTIGDNVIMGPDVHLISINHPTDVKQRLTGVMYARTISIGNACWIGARVTILPGASIGQGCTIGAGAVVTGRIPEYSVAVGVPAKVIGEVSPLE